MKKNDLTKKLALVKETVTDLTNIELNSVKGGATFIYCSAQFLCTRDKACK